MRRMQWASLIAAGLALTELVVSSPALASVVWRGDFETGNRSQWSSAQIVNESRMQVVNTPVRQGRYAMRVEVQQGDNPINASGNRSELVKYDGASEGKEFYYGWSNFWPSTYPLTPTWQVFMQWHHPGCCGAPPVRFVLGCSAGDCGKPLPDTVFFIVDGRTVWTMAPLTRGVWHDFVLHVKWSANPSVGFVELWYDGKLVVPKRYTRTMFNSSDTNYLKAGLYRDASTQPTAVLFLDGVVQATTFQEAVQPARAASGTSSSAATAPVSEVDTADARDPEPGLQGSAEAGDEPGGSAVEPDATAGEPSPQADTAAVPAIQEGVAQERYGCDAASAAPWAALALLVVGPLLRSRRRAQARAPHSG